MRIVGCFLEFNGKFVILLRHAHKPDGNTWGLPSGKVEIGEQDSDAMIRELREETGYDATPDELEHLGTFDFASNQGKNYKFVTYRVQLKDRHDMQLETAAHAGYQWVTAKECYAMQDLIPDFHTLLKLIKYV